jgi:VWFA-related protein
MKRTRRSFGKVIATAFTAGPLLNSQVQTKPRKRPGEPADEKRPQANLRVDTNLVIVPVTVCDPLNRPVTGLEKEHFRLLEDKIEQTITHFSMDDEPVAVGLVFDVSGSMGPKLQKSRQAAAAFFRTANVEDEFFLIEFSDAPRLSVP